MDGINWNTWLQIFGLTVVNIGALVFGLAQVSHALSLWL